MPNLIIVQSISTPGVADDTAIVSLAEHRFAAPKNTMVQVILTSVFFNRQTTSFWKVELTIDSWESMQTGVKVVHTVPPFTILNTVEIKKCNWVKVRLTSINGGGAGIMNIYN